MSIDLTNVVGVSDNRGVITQIADVSGRVLWMLANDKPIVLEVAKQTLTTYAGETSYSGESFVKLDIYPKSATSTVDVTYGGLTKTLRFSGTNAKSVYFGTFNGVSDSIATPDSGTLIIEGGCSSFACGSYQSGSKAANVGYCSCITAVTEWGAMTEIAKYAFRDCTNLALTSLPSGIASIGSNAFLNCTGITLTDLPSSITSIGDSAFYGCTNLALTSLPSGITSIGSSTFYNCTGITLTDLPSSITSIGSSAFYGCTNLALTSLPSGITSIGSSAFNGCSKITLDITELPSGITSIPDNAFYRCTSLVFPNIPSGITSIGDAAFYECNIPSSITIPSSLKSIGAEALYNSKEYTDSIIYNGDLYSYCAISFGDSWHSYGAANTNDIYINGSKIQDLVIPDGITYVEANSFVNSTITSVVIPDSVTSIGNNAFRYCSHLSNVTIGSGVTEIGSYAFSGIGYEYTGATLDTITIPASVTAILNCAFYSAQFNSVVFANTSGWYVTRTEGEETGTAVDVTDPVYNTRLICGNSGTGTSYYNYYWYRS